MPARLHYSVKRKRKAPVFDRQSSLHLICCRKAVAKFFMQTLHVATFFMHTITKHRLMLLQDSDWIKTFAVLASDVMADAASRAAFRRLCSRGRSKARPRRTRWRGLAIIRGTCGRWPQCVHSSEDDDFSGRGALCLHRHPHSLGCNVAVAIGVLTFFCNFVPVRACACYAVACANNFIGPENKGEQRQLLCFIVPVSIHAVVGNLMEPRIFMDLPWTSTQWLFCWR